MSGLSKKIIILSLFLTLTSTFALAATPEPPASPHNYVVDLANIIDDSSEARLNGFLKELEDKTTAQIMVLTIQSLDGEDIEGFSLRTAEKWKPGQKGKDNGLLMTVAVNDRKYRIETGYGIEGLLPDSLVGSIGREYIVPYFRKGDYGTGITKAVEAIISVIAEQEKIEISGAPKITVRQYDTPKKKRGVFDTVIGIFVFIVMAYLFIRHPRLFLLLTSGRGGWSGGRGGGGFGGFGGGGGGSFGGGGASGRW